MNYSDENLLEMIELYAEEKGYVASEEELSEKFDNEVMPSILEQFGEKGKPFEDEVMVNEEFNNWTDMLCKDGEIHLEQYENYCYVGKYS